MSYYESNNSSGSPHLSSVAPRAPLPGYDHRDYRSPTQEVGDAWGPTSPPRGGGSYDGWGQNAAVPPSSNTPSFPTTNTTLVPRAPQTLADPSRSNHAASDYGPPEPAGGGGPSASAASSTLSPAQSAKEAFIRIRILGIDRQKKDMYIKFNAEVSLFRESVVSGVISG